MRYLFAILLVLLAGGLTILSAAQPDSSSTGVLLRLTTSAEPPQKVTGTLLAANNDSLVILANQQHQAIAREILQKAEICTGWQRDTGKGALRGAVLGGIGLGLSAAVYATKETDDWLKPSPGVAFLIGGIEGGLFGALVGAIIGSGSYSPKWKEIPADSLAKLTSGIPSIKPEPVVAPATRLQISADHKSPKRKPGTSHAPEEKCSLNADSLAKLLPAIPTRQQETVVAPSTGIQTSDDDKILGKTQAQARNKFRNLEFSISVGCISGGPPNKIENVFTIHNLADTPPSFIFKENPRPFTKTNSIPMNFSVSYRFARKWGVGFVCSKTIDGTTYGYRKPKPPDWESINMEIDYETITLAPLLYIHPPKVFKIGLGPAFFSTSAKGAQQGRKSSQNKMGLLADLRLNLPQNTTFFVELVVQYRYIPKCTIGPFYTKQSATPIVPAFKVNYSHWFVGFGIGCGG